jgi:hypothetical protein
MPNELVLFEIVMMTYMLSVGATTEILIRSSSGTSTVYYNFKGPLRYVVGRVVTQSL